MVATTKTGIALALGAVLAWSLSGCAPRTKAYPGPALGVDAVGVVTGGIEQGFRTKYIAILRINGHEKLEEWSGGTSKGVQLLPGVYEFRVEFKQMTAAATIPIVD